MDGLEFKPLLVATCKLSITAWTECGRFFILMLFLFGSFLCVRVATAIFSAQGQERVVHDFNQAAVAESLIGAAPFLNSRTDTARAFKFAFDNLINVSAASVGRRPGLPLYFVTVTDGLPTGIMHSLCIACTYVCMHAP
jgi:hypothetical protein